MLETWILMELADRGSLSDALRGGRFPIHDFTAIYRCLLDIASGNTYTCPLMQSDVGGAVVTCSTLQLGMAPL